MPANLRLRPLLPEDEPAARAAHTAVAPDGFSFLPRWDPATPWNDYRGRLEGERAGRPARGVLPATFLVAVVGDDLVGRVSVRHQLDAFHTTWGGHIGYAVVPAHRRRGYATEILRQSLAVARDVGIRPRPGHLRRGQRRLGPGHRAQRRRIRVDRRAPRRVSPQAAVLDRVHLTG